MPRYILRPDYIEKVRPYISKPLIKILTGQRRVGKSFIMLQIADVIRKEIKKANIIFVNCETEGFLHLKTYKDLLAFAQGRLIKGQKNFLFIDEVQEIEQFQLALRSLLAENKCDIYCTGSNAHMLSGELATHLAGRYIEISVHALSFSEFLRFHKLKPEYGSVMKYLTYGGMPYLTNVELTGDLPFEYLRSVYATIMLKDVVARENIRNITFLENLIRYLADNVGSLFSAANISKFLKSQHIAISPQLTLNYLRALTNAYIIHKVQRAEVNGLKIFEIGEKYYFEDTGLCNAITGHHSRNDLHKTLENAVFLHLIQSGYAVQVGKLDQQEIDFVANRNGLQIYVQVCLQLTDKEVVNREFGNLMQIPDNYPKFVVTLNDSIIGNDYKGIKQINLLDFLQMNL
ncbi:MAG: ATP-binding protein [Bacteroidales bacterium]|nr:ATP-binding protein [Bacteroidales bacterium]HPF01513.1 ATP-binding protein [Bacteroidales bacterium]